MEGVRSSFSPRSDSMRKKPPRSSGNAVIDTNDDAAVSKLSCIEKGYYQDEFVKYFVKDPLKRPPLINRGYYARVAAIRMIQSQFLSIESEKKQFVTFGAGFDTTYFLMKAAGVITKDIVIYEMDLPEVVANKISIILRYKVLRELISDDWEKDIDKEKGEIHSSNYHLMSADLNSVESLDKFISACGIDTKVPTLFLSECVLIYLTPEKGNAVIKWTADTFECCSFCTYEQIRPDDPFGVVMLQNLELRGCPLLSIKEYPSLEAQKKRYIDAGFERVLAADMDEIYNKALDKKDISRIEKLELFDELEEWRLIQQHYCIVWAFQDKHNTTNKLFDKCKLL